MGLMMEDVTVLQESYKCVVHRDMFIPVLMLVGVALGRVALPLLVVTAMICPILHVPVGLPVIVVRLLLVILDLQR